MRLAGVTIRVRDMPRSIQFYRDILGLRLIYGDENSEFASFDAEGVFLNLAASEVAPPDWGRIIFRLSDLDEFHKQLEAKGLKAPSPRNGSWGERYFHIRDPDGHELGLTQPIQDVGG